jgi:ABC-type multidrug transport system fused ATPase/permease subunit
VAFRLRESLRSVREMLKSPEPSRVRFRWRDFPLFLRFASPIRALGVVSLVLTVLTTGLGSLMPLSSKILIDFIILRNPTQGIEGFLESLHLGSLIPLATHLLQSLGTLILAMIIIAACIGMLGMLQRYLAWRFEQELTYNLQTWLFRHVLRFPVSFFRQTQVGYLMSRVSDDVDELQYLFTHSASRLIHDAFYVLFAGGILVTLSLKLSLILTAVLPLYVLISLFFGHRLRSVYQSERESVAEVARDIQEVLSGVEVVKSYVSEERETRRVSGRLRTVIQTRVRALVLSLMSGYSVRAAQFGATLLVMWFGVREIRNEAMTIGDYVAFTTYLILLTEAVRSLSVFHIELQPVFVCLDRLLDLFRVVPEAGQRRGRGDLTRPKGTRGEIRFQGVKFSYQEENPVLEDVHFAIGPGDVVALVGPSGAGKTTLINLILKFYEPQAGSIRLDGTEYSRIDPEWLREQISVVSQEVFLFNDTIENNIRYGKPEASRDEVTQAARQAHIHPFVLDLSRGYDTLIGERGILLSAGQRQRISVARAFLKGSPILVLDEPTSALDPDTERLVEESLADLVEGRTTFIISHRDLVASLANRVFVLEGGKLREASPLGHGG